MLYKRRTPAQKIFVVPVKNPHVSFNHLHTLLILLCFCAWGAFDFWEFFHAGKGCQLCYKTGKFSGPCCIAMIVINEVTCANMNVKVIVIPFLPSDPSGLQGLSWSALQSVLPVLPSIPKSRYLTWQYPIHSSYCYRTSCKHFAPYSDGELIEPLLNFTVLHSMMSHYLTDICWNHWSHHEHE